MPKVTRGASAFFAIFLVIGIIVLGVGVWMAVRSFRCSYWPVASGVIERSGTKFNPGSRHNGGGTCSPEVFYRYEVGGIHYTGTRLAFGVMSASGDYAQKVIDRYPAGKTVSVHYSPGDPALAVLETGIHGGTWICFLVGSVFTLFGAMFLRLSRAAAANAQTTSVPLNTQQPPLIMGLVFLIFGTAMFFVEPSRGTSPWVLYAVGAFFSLIGLFIFTLRLQNKMFSKILIGIVILIFLAIVHWVAFGPGERIGTSGHGGFKVHGVNVRTFFVIFVVVLDILVLNALVQWVRGNRNK